MYGIQYIHNLDWSVMKKKFLFLGAVFLLGSLLFMNKSGFAQNIRSGDNVSIISSENIDSALFTAGKNIDIAGTVNGDVYCAGMNVTISGSVKGDIFCAAQTVRVSGKVDGSIKLAGQVITLTSENIRNAGLAGQTITIDSKTNINQDLIVGGQDVTINGTVSRDLLIGAQNLIIDSKINRDIKGEVENLTLAKNAVIGRDIDFTSKNNINRQDGSKVNGKITKRQVKEKEDNKSFIPFGILYAYFALTIVSLVLILVFPSLFNATFQRIDLNIGKSALIGFAGLFLTPIIVTVMFMTVVGIPLAILLLLAWIVTLLLTGPTAAYFVGKKVWKNSKSTMLTMLIGSLLVITSYIIPVVGVFVMLVVGVIGEGALLSELFNVSKPQTKKSAKK